MWVRSLGWEESLEEEMATHSSILAWKTPWTEEPGELQSMGWQRNGHDWATQYKTWHHKTPRKEHGQNTLCINHSSIFLDQSPKAKEIKIQFSSVSQSCLTLWSHGLQHSRLPCPLPSPTVCSNSYQLSQWCHPGISFSVIPFSFLLQSFPASESFLMSQFFSRVCWPSVCLFFLRNVHLGLLPILIFFDRVMWAVCIFWILTLCCIICKYFSHRLSFHFAYCSFCCAKAFKSHLSIKRCLLLGRKAVTNLDSILKSRDITLPTK